MKKLFLSLALALSFVGSARAANANLSAAPTTNNIPESGYVVVAGPGGWIWKIPVSEFNSNRVFSGTSVFNQISTQGDGSSPGLFETFATNGNDRVAFGANINARGTNFFRFDVGANAAAGQLAFSFYSVTTFGPTNFIVLTNVAPSYQGAAAGLTNLAAISSSDFTNNRTINLANNPIPFTNIVIAGWGQTLFTNSGVVTISPTNYAASIPTNATSCTVGFSDSENVQIYNTWFHLTTNLVVSPTNLVVGRTICVRFPTNSLTFDVTVTNTAAVPIRWNIYNATNGSTSFTKTNTIAARLYLTAETNGVISADFGYYR